MYPPLTSLKSVPGGGSNRVSGHGWSTTGRSTERRCSTRSPACYALGGEEPTLTDANIVLGYLNPEHLAGGALPLNAEKSHQTLHDKIAAPLNLSTSDAAHGVYRIARCGEHGTGGASCIVGARTQTHANSCYALSVVMVPYTQQNWRNRSA